MTDGLTGDNRIMAAAEKSAQEIDATFTTPIQKDGAFATYVTVPGSAELLGTRRPVRTKPAPR